jgi:hypothetical protein
VAIEKRKGGDPSGARSWVIVDLEKNKSRPLITAPTATAGARGAAAPVWIDGGIGVILTGVFESLDGVDGKLREERARDVAVLLVEPGTGRTQKIGVLDSAVWEATEALWDGAAETLVITAIDKDRKSLPPQIIRRVDGKWVQGGLVPQPRDCAPVQLSIEQSLNDPPVVVARERATGKRTVVLDPNPWLRERRLGKVEHFEWKVKDGRTWSGGLYFPPDYEEGKRYPLVIQSYFYHEGRFRLDGGLKNHAARPLAASGIIVLSLKGLHRTMSPLEENSGTAEGFESAIDALDERELIDRAKVGVVGFSRSGTHVAHLLAFSSYPIAAAAFTDSSINTGWYAYVLYLFGRHQDVEGVMGAAPFGAGLGAWLNRSPSFSLDRVQAPLLLTQHSSPAIGYADVWTSLKRLEKPVELWAIPKGTHDLYPVKERLLGNQVYVDWFRFWLQGSERTVPNILIDETKESLAAQYVRWHELRKQHEADLKKPRPPRLEWSAKPVADEPP